MVFVRWNFCRKKIPENYFQLIFGESNNLVLKRQICFGKFQFEKIVILLIGFVEKNYVL